MGLKLPLLCTPTFSGLSLPGISPIVIDLQYSGQAINTGRYKLQEDLGRFEDCS